MTINARIRQIRKENDLTMEEFGKRIGIGKTSISHIESGGANPSKQTIQFICREFGVREEWLRTGEGPMKFRRPRNVELESQLNEILTAGDKDFRQRLVSLLLRLPPEHWKLLEQYARELMKTPDE